MTHPRPLVNQFKTRLIRELHYYVNSGQYTRTSLAKKIAVDNQTVHNIFHDKKEPSLDWLVDKLTMLGAKIKLEIEE